MAVQTNGHAKQPNGYARSSAVSSSSRSRSRPTKGFFARIPSIFMRYVLCLFILLRTTVLTSLRLCIWYIALTVIFRCPSTPSKLTSTSPAVCEHYFQTRAQILPHIQPYYETYLAPYTDKALPYVNTAKTNVYRPAVAFAQRHGAPRVAQASRYAQQQWYRTVSPQLQVVRQYAVKQYQSSLGPHVSKVQDRVMPYYTSIKSSTSDFYELEVLPAYRHTAPHARKLYIRLSRFTLDTALPYAQWSTDLTWTFVKRQIWPRIQVLYGENVEPQIFRISQRLGRYRDEKKLEAAADAIESSASSSLTLSTPTAAAASVASSISSSVDLVLTKASGVVAATPSMAATDNASDPAEQFAQDMSIWEEQVAKAVHQGAEHLRDRVQDICDRLIESQASTVGEALIVQLEEASASATRSLKVRVATIIHALPDQASDDDVSAADEKILGEVRKAGHVVKQKAQSVREWKQTYDNEATNLIEAAANSTLETVDNIRDLRLQDIGRRWASNSAITHKDWAKYNELKKTSNKWRDDVGVVALQHPRLTDAIKAATGIEERAMAIAEQAAKELTRLKEASQWKLAARDDSTDFDTKYIPAMAAKAGQGILNAVSDAKSAVAGSSQGSFESLSSAASSRASKIAHSASDVVFSSETGSVASAASKASSAVLGTQQASYESAASAVSQSVQSIASAASETIIGTEPGLGEKAATKVSEAVVGSSTPVIESISSVASSRVADRPVVHASLGPKAASLLSAAKARGSDVSSSLSPAALNPESVASDVSSSAASVASQTSDSMPDAGSVATDASSSVVSVVSQISSSVPDSKPVASDASSSVVSVASQASSSASAFESVTSDVSSSIVSVTSQVSVSVPDFESVTSIVSSSVVSVTSQISSSVFDSKPVASEASSSVASVVSQVSEAVPDMGSVSAESAKASRRVFGGAMAQAVPSARSIVLDEDIIIDDDESYSQKVQDIISKAGDKAAELTQAIQDAVRPTPTQGSIESITSLASAQYESALSAASSV